MNIANRYNFQPFLIEIPTSDRPVIETLYLLGQRKLCTQPRCSRGLNIRIQHWGRCEINKMKERKKLNLNNYFAYSQYYTIHYSYLNGPPTEIMALCNSRMIIMILPPLHNPIQMQKTMKQNCITIMHINLLNCRSN